MTDGTQEVHGLLFPEDVDVPEQEWFRIQFGDNVVHDLSPDGWVYVARQCGLKGIESKLIDSGVDGQGVRYASVKVSVNVDNDWYDGIGGADETSQAVRDPEFVSSVAETRALKRAIKRALGIRDAEGTPDPDSRASQSSDPPDIPAYPDGHDEEPEPEPAADVEDDDLDW